MLTPAAEYVAGYREKYRGPRFFFIVLPRGCDKTGLIGRISNFFLRFSRRKLVMSNAAATKEQAKLLLDSMLVEQRLNPWFGKQIQSFKNSMYGPGGSLRVLSSKDSVSSGRKDDVVILDELTFWQSRALYNVLFSGVAKRKRTVFIIITNAGLRGSWQYETFENAKLSSMWGVYSSPEGVIPASWMTQAVIDEIRVQIPAGHAKRVLDNKWVAATENPLITDDDIAGAIEKKCLWPTLDIKELNLGRVPLLRIGFDIGRTRDRSVITLIEELGKQVFVRKVIVMDKVRFKEQKKTLWDVINATRPYLKTVRIDRGAIGYQLAEEMEEECSQLCLGVSMSAEWQGVMGLDLKKRFNRFSLRIPNDPVMHADYQLVDEATTSSSGKPRLVTHREEEIGHADRFWSLALAVSECPKELDNIGTPKTRAYA